MATFLERFNKLLKDRDMTAADFSRLSGIPESTLCRYRSGGYEPKQERLEVMAAAFRVSIDYLIGRTDDPALPGKPAAPPIPGFDELTEENKKIVEQYIDFLLSKQ